MTSKALLLAAFALSVSAPAFASNGATFVNNEIGWETHATPSTKSRAEVVAELKAAQDAGVLANSYEFPAATKASPSKLSREGVQRGVTEMTDAERDAVHRIYGPVHGRDS
ncbi:MAG: hypothetical protein ABS56_00805 [Lautropia sp. SCN 69-89]|jgi:hypothetical protein|nr:MAG: hypothetical protein ABS56_00805 [Lautropia sp. SCN 69-89]